MHTSIHTIYTWGRGQLFAGKPQNTDLLIEWEGKDAGTPRSRRGRLAARDIELRVWLEPQVFVTGWSGCEKDVEDGCSLVMRLGRIHAGERKAVVLNLHVLPKESGMQDVIWLQWHYKPSAAERTREIPVHKLSLEFNRHTGILDSPSNPLVEKHIQLLQLEEIRRKSDAMLSMGLEEPAKDLLRRHADKMLLLAARSGDISLLNEAEMLYGICGKPRAAVTADSAAQPALKVGGL